MNVFEDWEWRQRGKKITYTLCKIRRPRALILAVGQQISMDEFESATCIRDLLVKLTCGQKSMLYDEKEKSRSPSSGKRTSERRIR
jgi:hypothetical protein